MNNRQDSNMIRTLAVFSILLLASVQIALAQNPVQQKSAVNNNSNNNFITYENPTYGIRIRYPGDWQKTEHLNANRFWVDFMSPFKNNPNAFPATLSVSVEGLNHTITTTTNEYVTGILNNAKQSLPDFQIIESNPDANMTGISAYKIVYSFLSQDPAAQVHFQSMNIWSVKDKKVYAISYTQAKSLYAAYLPTVQKMIDSFEIIK
ncbi:MAG: PsbP-related protein [Nitrososphaeraceae archaeon]